MREIITKISILIILSINISTKLNYNWRKIWFKAGKYFSTSSETKNKFLGDGVEFFKNLFHKDNLPFAGVAGGCIFLFSRGYHLENRVNDIEKKIDRMDQKLERMDQKFDHINQKLDQHFVVIMAMANFKNIPDELGKILKPKDPPPSEM
jgi:hypothetical protein